MKLDMKTQLVSQARGTPLPWPTVRVTRRRFRKGWIVSVQDQVPLPYTILFTEIYSRHS